jgi:serine protease Do
MKWNNLTQTILIAVFTSMITAAATVYFVGSKKAIFVNDKSYKANQTSYSDFLQKNYIPAAPTSFTSSAFKVTPAVVNIKSLQVEEGNYWEGDGSLSATTGSGVIISEDGYLVTNNHVIQGATDIQVTLSNKKEYEAEVIGTDPETDLALLKIKTNQKLNSIVFGNSDSVRVGEWVMAVGNPFNLESTVTAGIVSAKGRSINILESNYSIESFIQTDAAVNPGNSGGALVNTNGDLIGINTAIISRSGKYEGYSFAIPVNLVMKIVGDLKEYGKVQRGFLGVSIDDIDDNDAKELGLSSPNGVKVTRLSSISAAGDAGIMSNDVIIKVNDNKVKNKAELLEQVALYRPGNSINIAFLRKNKLMNVKVLLKNIYNNTSVIYKYKNELLQSVGIEVEPISNAEKLAYRFEGIKVTSVIRGSKLDRANLEPGFIIQKVNKVLIKSIDDLTNIIQNAKSKITFEGIYEKNDEIFYYSITK